ncbi:MAG: hypothetical protein JO072_02180 [Parafilimonas sp.]|nr:hypothetical protein [Parafilimonas sp.]
MKIYLTVVATTLLIISCKKDFTSSSADSSSSENAITKVTAVTADYFDSLFTRYNAGQWTGGDVANSYKLANGNSFWLFGDSFVDTVYPDRHRPVDAFIHNSIVLTDAGRNFITTLYGGTARNPQPFFNAKAPKEYWPNCTFTAADASKVYVMMATIKATGDGGLFGFEVIGNSMGTLSYPDLKLLSINDVSKNPKIDWSSATYEEGNYVYIYGAESTKANKYIHVLRTNRNNPFKVTEYYNGNSWVRDSSQSARLMGGVSEQYSFFKYQNKYYLLSQGANLSADIYLWDAGSPTGPFSNKRKVYHTPQAQGNIITYNATAHTEFIGDGKLLVGYCTNSLNGADIYKNADNYRPYFIWISDWQ